MSIIRILTMAVVLAIPGTAVAQEWTEFTSKEDRFTCNFPGEPKVAAIIWTSEHGAVLPGRVYKAELGGSRYSMTVIDYSDIERILTEKSLSCPAGAETCKGGRGLTGLGYWKIDLQGAPTYALWKLLQRDVRLTHLTWNQMGMVGGDLLQLTSADGSRTFAAIYMHQNKLYIMEGTATAGSAPPGLFQQSLGWIDEQGKAVRYSEFYIHQVHSARGAP
jgi:hypothetical protein